MRFIYDNQIPRRLLKLLKDKMGLDDQSGPFIPGGRYHNFKDFMGFPRIGPKKLSAVPLPPLPHGHIDAEKTFFKAIRRRDILVHYPYQDFDYLIEFLRQAAIDPKVRSIKMTLYRVAAELEDRQRADQRQPQRQEGHGGDGAAGALR